MSWFSPSKKLPENWKKLLQAMVNNCDAADSTVADYINNIAEGVAVDDLGGEKRETYLKNCLQELAKSAMGLLARLEGAADANDEALIRNNQGRDIVFGEADKPAIAIMSYDHDEAKGTVAMRRSTFGSEIWVDGRCIALVDLYHQAPESEDEEPYPQLVAYNKNEETVVSVRFFKDRIEVVPDNDRKPRWEQEEPDLEENVEVVKP